jgi:hypothetical protein
MIPQCSAHSDHNDLFQHACRIGHVCCLNKLMPMFKYLSTRNKNDQKEMYVLHA